MSFDKKQKDLIKESFKVTNFKEINKVSKCTYVNDNKETTIFYLCPCSTDFSPICKACAEKCHSSHKPTLTITGNYDCSCGKFNHYVTSYNFAKLKRECFYSKLFEVTPNRGFYINSKTNEQYCAVCYDNDTCLKEENKKEFVYKNNSDRSTVLNCDCESHNHDLNVISLNLEISKHLDLPFYMRNFNVNILFKIQTSKNLYIEQLINQIETYNRNKSSTSNYDIFTGYTNNSIFQLFAFFNRSWKNKYVFLNPFLEQFSLEDLIDFMRISPDIYLTNEVTAKLYYSGKFYFAEILFNYFIKSHIAKHNNLFSLKTVLNFGIGHRLHFMKNAKNFFKYNYDEDINVEKGEKIIQNIDKLGNEFMNLFNEFQTKAEKFSWDVFQSPFNSITLIFKYLIKYNLISDSLSSKYYSLIIDVLHIFLKQKEKKGLEDGSLHLIKSILYTAIYKNDDIILSKNDGIKSKDKLFFRKSENNQKLIKILLIILPHFKREDNYAKTCVYDFCIKKTFELLLITKDTYAYTLENICDSDKELLDYYKKNPDNPHINFLNEEMKNPIFKQYYNKISIITGELGNNNRLYFDYVISLRVYCRIVSDIFNDFREFYYSLKEKERLEIANTFPDKNAEGYINIEDKEKIEKEIHLNYSNSLKKVIKITDFLENIEEFIHIYAKGMEYTETDYDMESQQIDMAPILSFILDLFYDLLHNDPSMLPILTNTKPEIFIPCFIHKNPFEITKIDRENNNRREQIIKFLEVIENMQSSSLGIPFDSFYFYLNCIRQLIFLKGNDKNLDYLSSILYLLAIVIKRTCKKDLQILSVLELLNKVFENIRTQEEYKHVLKFFDNEKSTRDIEKFYENYFFFMSQMIINDLSLLDFLSSEIIPIDTLETFILKILNKEDYHKNYLLNYHAMHYYLLKKLSFNIEQRKIDDILGNVINKDYNPNNDISFIKITCEAKYQYEFENIDNDQDKRYHELINVLKIVRTIMREYYCEEHVCGFNLDFYENILLRPLYKILHLILLFNKTHDAESILIFEECLKSLYKISLKFFFTDESQKMDKFKEHKSIGEIIIKTYIENNELVQSMNKFVESDSYKSDFKTLYNSFIFTFLPEIIYPLKPEKDVSELDNINPLYKIYISKKRKIEDDDLSLIDGFKTILRETGIDFRVPVVKYFIEKIFDPLNENYVKPSYIITLNPDNNNDVKLNLSNEKIFKDSVYNPYFESYYKSDSIEELNPKYENSYCLLMLNNLFFRDSNNFQNTLDLIFGDEESIINEKQKEEIRVKKQKLRDKSIFLSYIIKNLVFTSVLIEIEKYYEIERLDSHGERVIYEDPIFMIGKFSLKFLQNLCEGHNQKEQDYYFNSYFYDKNSMKTPSDIFEKISPHESLKVSFNSKMKDLHSPVTPIKNLIHSMNISYNIPKTLVEQENINKKKPQYVLDNMIIRNSKLSIDERKNNLVVRMTKEKMEKQKFQEFEKVLETSFFNFLFINLRIIMNNLFPMNELQRNFLTNRKNKSNSNLNKLYEGFVDLIIEMLQGCDKSNFKFFYQSFNSYHLHEIFYSILSAIKVGNTKKKKSDSHQLYQSMVNAYEVSQLLFKGAPTLDSLFKDPMLINFELEEDIDYMFNENSYQMKISQFKLLNNFIRQGGISENQQSLISFIYNYEKLTELITKYTLALYLKHIKGIEIDSKDDNFLSEFKSIQLDENATNELMEKFKYDSDFGEDEYFKLISEMYLFMFMMAEDYKSREAKKMINEGNKQLQTSLNLTRSASRVTGTQARNLQLLRNLNNRIMTCKFFNGIMKKVEFKIDSKVKTLFFVIDPAYYKISDNSLFQFYNTVDRTSSSTKLGNLIDNLKIFMYEVDFGESTGSSKSIDFRSAIYYNFFVSLAVNIMLLLFIVGQGQMNIILSFITYTLSIGQLIVNSGLLVLFFNFKYNFYIKVAKDTYKLKGVEGIEKIINMIHIYVLDSFLFNEEIYLLNFMILMSILGIITHYNLFYFVLQLLVVINFVDTIKEIVIAFQIRFSQLFCMIGFLAILIFFFSNIGFFFYIDEFDAQINGKTENYCQTLLECAITYFNHGVRAGGGIGDILPEKDFIDMNSYTIRWTTDLIFYITVILLLLNMINGVIVSTFSQIRETSSQKEEDIEERCFICNKEKKDFEKKKIDFSNHCETEHNLYDYIMFFVMLKRIEEKDLDSDQTYINEKLDEKDIAFFPVGYAKGFEDEEDEEEKEDEDEKDDEDEL